ncbi:MAG: hypothetical protein K1X66_09635 [Verrucomicrobiae bacterium]|nr:hypothetical protein [Verrucomicrobiae bacterium]
MARYLFGFVIAWLICQTAFTQTLVKRTYWEVKISEDQNYVVALDAISSVGLHNYIVDGVLEVTETSIDTEGTALARFYYIEKLEDTTSPAPGLTEKVQPAIEAAKKAKEALETLAGGEANNPLESKKVTKNYPVTTHAKTIEYRLATKADVKKIYDSVSKALKENLTTTQDFSKSDK